MKRRTSSVLFRQRRTDPEYYGKGLGIAPRINPALEKVTASPEYSAIKARWIKASLIVAYRKDTPLKGIAPQTFLYAIGSIGLSVNDKRLLVLSLFKSFQYIMRVANIILSTRTFKM